MKHYTGSKKLEVKAYTFVEIIAGWQLLVSVMKLFGMLLNGYI